MRRVIIIAIIVAASIGGLYAIYASIYPTYSYRYRITVDVETTGGLRSSSSVLEVTTIQYPAWVTLGANDHHTTARGEAVFVDLGNGSNVIALLALGPHAEDGRWTLFAPRSFFKIHEGSPRDIEWTRTLSLSTNMGRRPYAGDKSPTLITIADLNDPATVREIPFENPRSVLGPDVRSVRAWIDLTKDPVTAGLESKLPWIGKPQPAQVAWRIIRQGKGSGGGPLQMFKLRGE